MVTDASVRVLVERSDGSTGELLSRKPIAPFHVGIAETTLVTRPFRRAGVARPDPACLQHMQRGPHARSSWGHWLRLALAQISTPSAAHFLKSHQLFSAKVCGGSRLAKILIQALYL